MVTIILVGGVCDNMFPVIRRGVAGDAHRFGEGPVLPDGSDLVRLGPDSDVARVWLGSDSAYGARAVGAADIAGERGS